MAVTVELRNFTDKPFAHPQFTGSVGAFDGGPTTKSVELKTVNADDYAVNYDELAGFGVLVLEDSTKRPGWEELTAAGTVADTTHLVEVDTDGTGFTVTLPDPSTVGSGWKIWVHLRTDGGGDLTVDSTAGNVLGSASQTLADVNDRLIVESDGTDWVTPS